MPRELFAFDESYLRRLANGDPDAECHFVDYFSNLLRAKLRLRVRSVQDVEDLRQEVFLRVLQSLRSGPGLQDAAKLGAFVHSVCNNVVLEHMRSQGRVSQWDDQGQHPASTADDAEHQLLSDETRDTVRVVLDELPDRDRGLLRAVFLEERDKDSVCRYYGVERDYLRVLLHRARRRLRDLLAPAAAVARKAPESGGARP